MSEPDLTLRGQLVTTLQGDMRELRATQTAFAAEVRTDLAAIRALIASHLTAMQVALETHFDQRMQVTNERLTRIEIMLGDIDRIVRE